MQEKIEANSSEELKEKVKRYLQEFPVPGYGTHQGVVKEEDGKFITYMYRERSCD